MDLDGIMLSEISPIENNKDCVISLPCGILKEKQINEEKKTETDIDIGTNYWLPEWKGGRGDRKNR